MALDEEHVEMVQSAVEKMGEPPDDSPPLAEWSLTVEMLANLVDELRMNTLTTVAAAGARPPRFQPVRRPSTAHERVAHRRRLAGHKRVVDLVMNATAQPSPDSDPLSQVSQADKG